MICPSCGSTSYRESRQCPAYGGTPVCISCCMSCEDYSPDGIPCRWYIHHPVRDIRKEIAGLKKKAELMKKKILAMREQRKFAAARRLEEDWWLLWQRIRELEEELNETGT